MWQKDWTAYVTLLWSADLKIAFLSKDSENWTRVLAYMYGHVSLFKHVAYLPYSTTSPTTLMSVTVVCPDVIIYNNTIVTCRHKAWSVHWWDYKIEKYNTRRLRNDQARRSLDDINGTSKSSKTSCASLWD